MSSNVGLSTPRGTGTSGYVQRNLSLLKPRDAGVGAPYSSLDRAPKARKPDSQILRHDRLREIEVELITYREGLEDDCDQKGNDLTEEDIDEMVEEQRKKLTAEMEKQEKRGAHSKSGVRGKGLKSYQVHELAEAKEKESEKLRKALGLKGDEADESGEHPMARQEKRRRLREEEEEGRDDEDGETRKDRDAGRRERH